jgi:hypothetical protein
MRGIDYSFASIDSNAIRGAGYEFVVRYIGTSGKCITQAEYQRHHAAGLGVALVYEAGAADALNGAQTGHDHAVRANAAADALGFPRTRPIYYACDFDDRGDARTFEKLTAYFDAASAVGVREVGVYGSSRVCDWFRARGGKWAWQTVAWSKGRVSGGAQLLQQVTHAATIAGTSIHSYDDNLALASDFGQDNAQTSPPPQPPKPKVPPVIDTKSPLRDIKTFKHGLFGTPVTVALTEDGGIFAPPGGVGFTPFSPVGQAYWKGHQAAALAVAGDATHPLSKAEAKAKCAYVVIASDGSRFAFGQGKG